jgi:hypothetical protein
VSPSSTGARGSAHENVDSSAKAALASPLSPLSPVSIGVVPPSPPLAGLLLLLLEQAYALAQADEASARPTTFLTTEGKRRRLVILRP